MNKLGQILIELKTQKKDGELFGESERQEAIDGNKGEI